MRRQLRLTGLATLSVLLLACGDSSSSNDNDETGGTSGVHGDGDGDQTGDGDGDQTGDGDGDQTGDGDGDQTGDGDGDQTGDGDPGECVITECAGKLYECGNCLDDDDDGKIDAADPDCWGPCDNNEGGFKGNIPGQANAPCTSMDCYFDQDSGTGNDKCYWSHSCDPSEPNPSSCNYSPNSPVPGSGMSCEQAKQNQGEICLDVCGPLVPNGCDCFGCCEIKSGGETYTVYLGTEDAEGNGSCSLADVADPQKCAPCVQVDGCLNPCEADECEICIGGNTLPDDCDEAGCPDGIQSCDPDLNSADCPSGMFCITGCCYPTPG
ncbi:MAG: hypothetical protein R6X02_19050 [Enhygromyxa sp.]